MFPDGAILQIMKKIKQKIVDQTKYLPNTYE